MLLFSSCVCAVEITYEITVIFRTRYTLYRHLHSASSRREFLRDKFGLPHVKVKQAADINPTTGVSCEGSTMPCKLLGAGIAAGFCRR